MVVYHDGGFTPAKDTKTKQETAGWGYHLELMTVHRNPSRDRLLRIRQAYGPVQLEEDKSDFCGCIKRSNNTAELSAVPLPGSTSPYLSFYGRLYGGNMCNVKT